VKTEPAEAIEEKRSLPRLSRGVPGRPKKTGEDWRRVEASFPPALVERVDTAGRSRGLARAQVLRLAAADYCASFKVVDSVDAKPSPAP